MSRAAGLPCALVLAPCVTLGCLHHTGFLHPPPARPVAADERQAFDIGLVISDELVRYRYDKHQGRVTWSFPDVGRAYLRQLVRELDARFDDVVLLSAARDSQRSTVAAVVVPRLGDASLVLPTFKSGRYAATVEGSVSVEDASGAVMGRHAVSGAAAPRGKLGFDDASNPSRAIAAAVADAARESAERVSEILARRGHREGRPLPAAERDVSEGPREAQRRLRQALETPASERATPARSRFTAGVQAFAAQPSGPLSEDPGVASELSTAYGGGYQVGWRWAPGLFVDMEMDFGTARPPDGICRGLSRCEGAFTSVMLMAGYHAPVQRSVAPWGALGYGFDGYVLMLGPEEFSRMGPALRVETGLDISASSYLTVGPVLACNAGRFALIEPGVRTDSVRAGSGGNWHSWLLLGVRARLAYPFNGWSP